MEQDEAGKSRSQLDQFYAKSSEACQVSGTYHKILVMCRPRFLVVVLSCQFGVVLRLARYRAFCYVSLGNCLNMA
jgi:hypothetical protein